MIHNKSISSKIFVGILILFFLSISSNVLAEPASEAWLIVGTQRFLSVDSVYLATTIKIMNPNPGEAIVRCLKFNVDGGLVISENYETTIPPLGIKECYGTSSNGGGSVLVVSDTAVLVTAYSRSRDGRTYAAYSKGRAWQLESYSIEVERKEDGLICSASANNDTGLICALIDTVSFGNNDTVPSP